MTLKDLLPPSDLLSRVDGVEAGLRQVKRIGRFGQVAFLLIAVFGVIVESGVVPEAPRDSWLATALQTLRIGTRLLLPLLVLLLVWSKFWLRQSRHPFRYTCSVTPIRPVEHSPISPELTWMSQDLKALLSQRIERLRFLEPGETGAKDDSHEGHIAIGGTYVVRAQGPSEGSLAVEVMPEIGIGGAKSPKTVAHPVTYPSDPVASPLSLMDAESPGGSRRVKLSRADYQAILERVYFSVATEIYQQIRVDVERKVELMPTSYLAGQALYHEAKDYARSNTLNAYEQAKELYEQAARCFDRSLSPLPASPPRLAVVRVVRAAGRGWRRLRRRAAMLWPALARRDVACAQAQIGFANMLINRRVLASLSGMRVNPVFEARSVAAEALARLEALAAEAPERLASCFEARVTLARSHLGLGSTTAAEEQLGHARSLDPARADSDATFLFAQAELAPHPRTRLQILRRAVEARPRFEIAQFSLAYETEQLWRSRPTLERTVAEMAFDEYQLVLDINPGNVGAWANRGYMRWLLGEDGAPHDDLRQAHADFQAGRDYKAIKRETLVAELDYGLARIAAERGELERAYRHYVRATSALIGHGELLGDLGDYYFSRVGPAMVQRFERYRRSVEANLSRLEIVGSISPRVLSSVYAFVLNDYGECCYHYALRSGDGRHRERAQDAFDLASEFNGNYVMPHSNLARLANLQEDPDAAECHALRVQELEPKWPHGILTHVAARTARAARERRDANRAQEIAAQCSRQLDEMLGGGEPGALAPGRGTASPPPPDNAGLVPLDQVRSERTAKLREEKADAERQVKEATEQAQTAEREVRRLVRQLVPHDWLWTSLPGSDDADLDWAKLSDFNARQEIRWTRELDDLNVQALLAYGDSVRVRPDGQERAAQLFRHLRHLYLPSDFRLLTALRECVRGEARGEYDAAIGVLIELSHIKDPVHFDTLQWFTDRWCNVERRLDVFAGASARAGPAGELQAWLADQLCTITERTDLASSVHRRAHKHALEAVGAACSGAPPSVLWRMGLLAARLGRLDLSRVAYERAMEVDAGPAGVRGDVAARRDGARAARTASEYASSFAQFLEVVRRPEGPSRTRAEYTVMRVATRLLQQQFDEALAELGALSSSVCEADSGWRTRLVEPLGKLLEAAGRAGASVAVLDHTYYTLKDWLSIQPAQLAVSPEVQSDGLRSGLRLTGERHGGLRGRAAAAVPQARAGAFYPMVTPVALEVAAVLAAAIGLREGSVAFTTYLPQMRERILQDTGIRVPGVRIRENASDLGANQYLIMINEIPLELGHVPGHSVFVPEAKSGPARTQARIGRRCTTKAPAGEWVRTDPPGAGMPPAGHWAPLSYVVAHLEGVLRRFLAEFLSLDEAAGMFEGWRTRRLTPPQAQFALELTSDHRMVVEAVRVLRALLEEGVPLVAPGAALDGLRSALATSSLIDAIERMRGSVREWLPGNEIAWRHLRLAPDVEKVLLDGLAGTGTAPGLTLSPEDLQEVLSAIRTEGLPDYDAAIVVGPAQLRPYVLRILEEEWPQVPVLTRDELTPSLQVRFSEFPAITLA